MASAALEPHPATPCAAVRSIRAAIERSSGRLHLSYVVEGEIARLRLPARRTPRAAERLWQRTCCELFIGRRGEPDYREFNFSPSTEWAAYEFERYRERVRTIDVYPTIEIEQRARSFQLAASIPWEEIGKLLVGLSAVIEEQSGALSYWALKHAPGKPDFHHREAFALELE